MKIFEHFIILAENSQFGAKCCLNLFDFILQLYTGLKLRVPNKNKDYTTTCTVRLFQIWNKNLFQMIS